MDDVEKAQKQALEMLKSINSLDDLKEHKDELITLLENIFKSGTKTLKEFLESTLSPEEKGKEMEKFQDESWLFSREIELEIDRIDELPGVEEYFEIFRADLDKRLEPSINEVAEQMNKIMTDFMGEMMGGVMDGLGEVFGSEQDEKEEPPEVRYEYGELEECTFFSYYPNIESMKNDKDSIIEGWEMGLKDDIESLKDIQALDWPYEDIKEDIENAEKKQNTIDRELELGFKNLAELPGAAEEVKLFKDEMMARIEPLAQEVHGLVKELKKRENK